MLIKFVEHNNSVATKKGNKEGIIELVQIDKPSFAASRLDSEKTIKDTANNIIKKVIKNFLNDRIKILIKNPPLI